MSRKTGNYCGLCCVVVIVVSLASSMCAQNIIHKRLLITQSIDEENVVALHGTMRPEVLTAHDLGPVSNDFQLQHMYLLLSRQPEQQQAIEELVGQLHDKSSPQYHRWLSASEIAQRFGPADEDINSITQWLRNHGFVVHGIYSANGVIDFSGSAAQVGTSFHTQIHKLEVGGERHIANISEPQIPAALAPAIHGVVSLNDFRPRPMSARRIMPNYTVAVGGSTYQLVTPGDLEKIYDLDRLYAEGLSGEGQRIVVIEDSDVFTAADWHTFRKAFGLQAKFPKGSFRQMHPQPRFLPDNGGSCADPGVNPADSEAIADAEWATAAAPNAEIVLAACADTNTNFGGFIAMQNLLTGLTPAPAVMSISYGADETELGDHEKSANVWWRPTCSQ